MARYRWLLLLLLALAGFAVLELWPSDSSRIAARLQELARLVPTARDDAGRAELEAWLNAHASPNLIVRLEERGVELNGAAEASRFAHDALAPLPLMQIALDDKNVRVEGSAARATVACALISQGAGEFREMRRVISTWSKRSGEFQLDVLEVDPRRRDQPEARP